MVNPTEYKFEESIDINIPTLLDTKKVHAVMFGNSNFTHLDPRISLSVKWKSNSFEQVISQIK